MSLILAALTGALLAAKPAAPACPVCPVCPGADLATSPFPEPAEAPAPRHPLDIHADHLTVYPKESRTVWTGKVHAVRAAMNGQPALHLRCDTLVGSTVNERDLDKVTCSGHVTVVQGDRAGWGEQAVYDKRSGELVVTGQPHGQQGANTFRGDKLTFYVDSDRIEVQNAFVNTPAPGPAKKAGQP